MSGCLRLGPRCSCIEGKSEREERLRNRRIFSHLTVGIMLIITDEITTRKSRLMLILTNHNSNICDSNIAITETWSLFFNAAYNCEHNI